MQTFTPLLILNHDIDKYQEAEKKDFFQPLLWEYFLINDPQLYFSAPEEQRTGFEKFKREKQPTGAWVFHPWSQKLYHLLERDQYYHLRTARNQRLVTSEEQETLRNKTIAVAGLSVGSNILLSLARYGIGQTFKIADSDLVAVSNFNRTTYDLRSFNQPKTQQMLKSLNELDPFLKVEVLEKGLSEQTLKEFLSDSDIVVDAFDNFPLKLQLRQAAKRQKIPVVSGFDVEKGVLLIVERYDLEPDLDNSLFLNNHDSSELQQVNSTPAVRTQLFIDIIGQEYHSAKMLDSVTSVGKSLTGYPQVIIATLLAASLFTATIEDILLNRTKGSFRKYISLDNA